MFNSSTENMGTIKAIKDRYASKRGSLSQVLAATVAATSDVLLDLNRDQLLYGRDVKGEPITPKYYEDPYFKTYKQAVRYSVMKRGLEDQHKSRMYYSGIQLFPDKGMHTPNLLVTGDLFFNHFFIDVTKDSYTIGSSGLAAPDIEAKYMGYGHPLYGLAPVSKKFYYENWLRQVILEHLKK